MNKQKSFLNRLIREWLGFAIFALLLFAARSSIADWNRIPSGSMEPTIYVGDLVLVNKLAFDLKVPFTTKHLAQWSNPQKGDIVVFYKPDDGQRLVKRVIGTPGDSIEMRDNTLILNGEPVPYNISLEPLPYPLPQAEKNNTVLLNERLTSHNHAIMTQPTEVALRSFGPVKVPENQYFMLGDNRDGSGDSRYFGFVPRDKIVGRAENILLSWDKENYYKPRFSRTLQQLV